MRERCAALLKIAAGMTPPAIARHGLLKPVQLYGDGMTLRPSSRPLGVVHQPVAHWVAAHAGTWPDPPPPTS